MLGLLVFAGHALSPNATSSDSDSRSTVQTARGLVRERNADLNEYLNLLEQDRFFAIECVFAGKSRVYPVHGASPCAGGQFYHF